MARRPNVLMIYADDLVWDWEKGMPYLASEPEGSWVRFPNACHTTPLCGPSRSTLVTGLYATTHGNSNNEIGEEAPDGGWNPRNMVAPALKSVGARPGFMGKYINGHPWGGPTDYRPPGWWSWRCTQANQYDYFSVIRNTGGRDLYTDGSHYLIDTEGDLAVEFIQSTPEPWSYVWASKAPHSAGLYNFPPAPRHEDYPITLTRRANFNPTDEASATKPPWWQATHGTQLDTEEVAEQDSMKIQALRILKSLDEAIEATITELKNTGKLDDTIIIFCGDNSNLFGEHRHYSKAVPYEEAINMYLMVRYPGHPGGTNDALVSNIDIAPTMLDLMGGAMNYHPDGMSFAPLLTGVVAAENYRDDLLLARDEEDPVQFTGTPGYRGVRTRDGRLYVEYRGSGAGQREFYDIATDPYQMTNLAENPAHADEVARMARKLATISPD